MRRTVRAWGLVAALSLAGAPAAARAACAEHVEANRFARAVSTAEALFVDMDATGFFASRKEALALLECLAEPIGPAQAAAFYRMEALAAFLDQQKGAAVAAFRALLDVAPRYELPETLAPEGHPLREYFEIADQTAPIPRAPLPEPREGQVLVDGTAATTVPQGRPYVFQYVDAAGTVQVTQLVPAGGSVPEYPARPERASIGLNLPLAVGAGVAGLAAGGLYLAAAHQEEVFWDEGTDSADLAAVRRRANTLGALSTGMGVVAVGTGVAAVLTGTW